MDLGVMRSICGITRSVTIASICSLSSARVLHVRAPAVERGIQEFSVGRARDRADQIMSSSSRTSSDAWQSPWQARCSVGVSPTNGHAREWDRAAETPRARAIPYIFRRIASSSQRTMGPVSLQTCHNPGQYYNLLRRRIDIRIGRDSNAELRFLLTSSQWLHSFRL
jgi:hypothetical protein